MAKCDKCKKEVHPNDLELVEESNYFYRYYIIGRPFWVCTECCKMEE